MEFDAVYADGLEGVRGGAGVRDGGHEGVGEDGAGGAGSDVDGPDDAFVGVGGEDGGRVEGDEAVEEAGFRDRRGEVDIGDVAAGREGDGVDGVGFEACVRDGDVECVRGGFGDAEGFEAGREPVQKGWGGGRGEWVEEPEVGRCCRA